MNSNIERISAEIVAKEQMLAIVFHDIKNPIAAIQLEAQMLLRSAERAESSLLSEEVKIQARRILKTTERIKILISDLLKENQFENGLSKLAKETYSIRGIIQEVLDSVKILSSDKNIALIIIMDSETQISLDKNKIIQVLSNLYNNAIQFTPRDGTIELSIVENDFEYVFSLEDSGKGIEERLYKNIFEKYWSSNSPDGTGLGLYICKSIIEAHAGHIYVDKGTKYGGARFIFTIPKNIGQGRDRSFSFLSKDNEERKKIFIIDDDDDLREALSWALGKEGFEIFSFGSPKAALDCLKLVPNPPDLIIVDYHMNEMDGGEFVERKKAILKDISCSLIMISASPQDVENNISRDDYLDILIKPIDLNGLVSGIRKSFIIPH